MLLTGAPALLLLLLLPLHFGVGQTYLRNEGVKSLSYNAAGRSSIAGGDSVQALEEEMQASSRRHDSAGLVSIVVREATERPVKVGTCVAGAGAGD